MLIFHTPQCTTYRSVGHPEKPTRVSRTVDRLREGHPEWEWREPEPAAESVLRLAHTAEHLSRLREPQDFDADTPWFDSLFNHASRASGAAVGAAELALSRPGPVFSLMRPPGHHACADRAMGFCHFNHVALAALSLHRRGVERVAIWDFDAHHGNGTEAILRGKEGVLFASVHQYPGYPGTGFENADNCRNWPLPPGTDRKRHLEGLAQSWETVTAFRPEVVIVSAGFDAFAGDPLTDLQLEPEDFGQLGSWLRQAGLPVAAVLEGGYSTQLPDLIDNFLSAWAE